MLEYHKIRRRFEWHTSIVARPVVPIRMPQALVDTILGALDGAPSTTPHGDTRRSRRNVCLRATLLQVVYSVRSERLLMEPLNYTLRRWRIVVRSWRCQTQRAPAGEIDNPRLASSPATHSCPQAGCSNKSYCT